MPNDISEVIQLLKAAEKRSVTHQDLQNVADSLLRGVKGVEDQVHILVARMGTQDIAIDALGKRVSVVEKVVASAPPVRRMSPMPQRFDPEETSPGGSLRMTKAEWDSVMITIEEHSAKLEAAEKAKHEAELSERAVQALLRTQEKEMQTRRKRWITIASILFPLLAGLGGTIEHYFHIGGQEQAPHVR